MEYDVRQSTAFVGGHRVLRAQRVRLLAKHGLNLLEHCIFREYGLGA